MTLTQKIWLLVTVPFVVALATYLIATRPFRRELLVTEASRDARDDVVVLQSAITKGLIDEKDRINDLTALTESIAQAERVIGIAVYGIDGQPLAESSGIKGNGRVRELAERALRERREIRDIRGRPPHLEHAFLLDKTGSIAVCVVIRDIGYVDALVGAWTRTLFYIAIGSVLVMLLISGPLVRRIVGTPLQQVVTGVGQVAEGKLDVRVPDTRRDELGLLARSFNAMTESLRTARARVDAETTQRAALEARMRQLQTLAAAGEVAASLAHEIGSPLNVILGRTRMMAARADTADKTKRDLEIVAQQTERITRVVRKLLDISRPPKGRVEQVDVREVVEETLAFIQPECKKRRITQSSTVDADAPARVLADRDQLVQIVFNLCHNAIQAQPEGGKIDVRIRRAEESISGAPALAIEVRDSGPGVPAELRGRIFDPFVTTKPSGEGTGLGLFISREIVQGLGGHIHVESEPGRGTSMRVVLPATTKSASSSSPPRRVTAPFNRRRRLLVIDDEDWIGLSLRRAFEEEMSVVTATGGREALALLEEDRSFDAVLCDIVMPEVDGLAVFREIEARDPELARRFVFMSGGALTADAQALVTQMQGRFIEKPFAVEELRALLHRRMGTTA